MTDHRISPDPQPTLSSQSEADTLSNVCPVCGLRYPSTDRFCAIDGQPLRDVRPTSDPLIGSVIGDRYFVQRRLGQGGMGVVYLAEHVRIGRRVAVKVLLPEYAHDANAVARFHREAANLSRVNHPNVASLFDYGESAGGLLYLAMEFADGDPLSAVLAREDRLPVGRVAAIVAQTAAALHAAHGLGIVHRDLKPENIIVAPGPNEMEVVKVVDFGIARAVKETAQRVTESGAVIGTLAYMSPEQLSGDEVDSRSDLFSLALVTCVLLTGKLPFRTDSQKDILERLTSPPAPLASLAPDTDWPVALQFALNRALHADPTQRHGSTQQFARDVIDALDSWQPGVISPLVRALGVLGQDVAATLSPDVIIRHATPDAMNVPVEATGRQASSRVKPVAVIGATLVVVSAAIAAWVRHTPASVVPTKPADTQLAAEKSPRVSISSLRPDSAVPPPAARQPLVRTPTSEPGRTKAQSAPKPTRGSPPQQPSRPVASQSPLDSTLADEEKGAAPESTAARAEPIGSAVATPVEPTTGFVQIGTHESGVVLYVNGRADRPLTRLGVIRVPVGTVRLQLRAEQCQGWDSTVTVRGGETVVIGWRKPKC